MGAMEMRPLLLLPEIILFLGGLIVLIGGSFLARDRQWVTRVVAAMALLAAATVAAVSFAGPAEMAMEGTFTVDVTTGVARIVAMFALPSSAPSEITNISTASRSCAAKKCPNSKPVT